MFNAEQECNKIVQWIREWFNENGKDCNAIIGISGGKDSTVVAALLVEALGKDRVIGVMMPNHIQDDIDDSIAVCKALGIKNYTVDIGTAYDVLIDNICLRTDIDELTQQTVTNLPPRLRMATLYAIGQSKNGRVANTCNLSETLLSWETRWGDAVGDFAPIVNLTVSEVIAVGYVLANKYNIPIELIDKTPSDGLCGSSDEEKLGILYKDMDSYIRTGKAPSEDVKNKIDYRLNTYRFKRKPIPAYVPALKNYLD